MTRAWPVAGALLLLAATVYGNGRPPLTNSIRDAMTGRSRHGTASVGGELFLIVSEPARFAEEVLGTMTAGFASRAAIASCV